MSERELLVRRIFDKAAKQPWALAAGRELEALTRPPHSRPRLVEVAPTVREVRREGGTNVVQFRRVTVDDLKAKFGGKR